MGHGKRGVFCSRVLAERVLASNPGFGVGRYQGDAVQVAPHFALTEEHNPR